MVGIHHFFGLWWIKIIQIIFFGAMGSNLAEYTHALDTILVSVRISDLISRAVRSAGGEGERRDSAQPSVVNSAADGSQSGQR